jgi:curved DNA-binding protein CbpA
MQIGRGIVATPESLIAPRQGKWWNEYEGKWVLTKLPEDAEKTLKGITDDDKDILGKVQDEIDASITGGHNEEVKDMFYYDILEVPASAEGPAIKRKYYLLAKKYHPDRVSPDDKEAGEKFKDIAEAYQVLSDPELRKKYDTDGREGLSADKTDVAGGVNPNIDPTILFAFLFGSDQFQDYVGRLSTATSASVGDSQKISLSDARTLQKRRVTRLALKLVDKITPWVDEAKAAGGISGFTASIEDQWKSEAVKLSNASYGHQLVTTIGKVCSFQRIERTGSRISNRSLTSFSSPSCRPTMLLPSCLKDLWKVALDYLNLANGQKGSRRF